MAWIMLVIIGVGLYFFLKNKEKKNLEAYRVYGDESYEFDIVGEASYQINLQSIAGKKTKESKEHQCIAIIRLEPNNAYDKNAVAVGIDNKLVGYFSRADALRFHQYLEAKGINKQAIFAVQALIVGGWKARGSEGNYGVKLDIPYDFNQWNSERIKE